jgi:hypothetical protein
MAFWENLFNKKMERDLKKKEIEENIKKLSQELQMQKAKDEIMAPFREEWMKGGKDMEEEIELKKRGRPMKKPEGLNDPWKGREKELVDLEERERKQEEEQEQKEEPEKVEEIKEKPEDKPQPQFTMNDLLATLQNHEQRLIMIEAALTRLRGAI